MASPLWHAARTVVAYAATGEETDTRPLLDAAWARGTTVILPAVVGREIAWRVVDDPATQLVPGVFGIAEPAASARPWQPMQAHGPVLWIVPGVGFDRQGRRLGRGGGYYDRALRAAQARTGTVGLAFPCQIVEAIPVADDDWPVESVVTADTWIAAVTIT